jgi:hypothetical protein
MRRTLAAISTYLALQTVAPAFAEVYNPASNPDYTRQCRKLASELAKSPEPRVAAQLSRRFFIPLHKAREIFPEIEGYKLVKDVKTDFKDYYFYKNPSSKYGWDIVVEQGLGGIYFVYIKNGGIVPVPKHGASVVEKHDIAFRFMPNSLDISVQPEPEKIKKVMGWAYYNCGDDDRISIERVFASDKSQATQKAGKADATRQKNPAGKK